MVTARLTGPKLKIGLHGISEYSFWVEQKVRESLKRVGIPQDDDLHRQFDVWKTLISVKREDATQTCPLATKLWVQ